VALVVVAGVAGHQLGALPVPITRASHTSLMIDNPYAGGGDWYKGDLQIASIRGVGRDLPSAISDWYRAHGYDFLGISDQNTYTWDSEYSRPGFTGMPAVDASYPFADVVAVGIDHWLPADNLQSAIDWIGRDGGLPMLAAPLAPAKPQSLPQLLALHGLFGFEVYDARLAAINPGQGDATADWDRLLSAGHRVFGFAGDDLLSLSDPTVGSAWINVLAPAPDLDSLFISLRAGAFTASTGADFVRFSVSGTSINVEAAPGCSLRFIGRGGRLLKSIASPVGSYRVTGDEGYVRVEALRDDGGRAWSQPFFLSRR
jgi:hypothetical protein